MTVKRRVAQLQVTAVFVDEFDALSHEGPYPFQGDKDGTAVEKLQEFLTHLNDEPEVAPS